MCLTNKKSYEFYQREKQAIQDYYTSRTPHRDYEWTYLSKTCLYDKNVIFKTPDTETRYINFPSGAIHDFRQTVRMIEKDFLKYLEDKKELKNISKIIRDYQGTLVVWLEKSGRDVYTLVGKYVHKSNRNNVILEITKNGFIEFRGNSGNDLIENILQTYNRKYSRLPEIEDREKYDEDPTKINNEYKKKYYDILIGLFENV